MVTLFKTIDYVKQNISSLSYWVCLSVALFSLIFYAIGFKRCAKYAPASIAVYALIKMLGSAFK